jgi:hypothetical protein
MSSFNTNNPKLNIKNYKKAFKDKLKINEKKYEILDLYLRER